MAAVLVTRFGPEGEALCRMLTEQGHQVVSHPLLRILPGTELAQLPDMLSHSDFIIAVSGHAAELANQYLTQNQIRWPGWPVYLAVGQKTAHKLSKVSQQKVHYPGVSDSEHLLKLPLLEQVTGKQITILRGNGGRELIRETLESRGATVNYCETYQREWLPFDGQTEALHWQAQNIDTLVVTSGEQLSWLVRNLPAGHFTWLRHSHLIVPSQRIADDAGQLGFTRAVSAGGATNPDLLRALSNT